MRRKSALHQESYRWIDDTTKDFGGDVLLHQQVLVEHLLQHHRRWNYYSSDQRHHLIGGAASPPAPLLDWLLGGLVTPPVLSLELQLQQPSIRPIGGVRIPSGTIPEAGTPGTLVSATEQLAPPLPDSFPILLR